jgi:hypothetical protein
MLDFERICHLKRVIRGCPEHLARHPGHGESPLTQAIEKVMWQPTEVRPT